MDQKDVVSLVPQWRSGRDNRGNVLDPKVAETKRACADELESALMRRLTLGSTVQVKDKNLHGVVAGGYQVSPDHPMIFIVRLEGGGEGTYMRHELEVQPLQQWDRSHLEPLSASTVDKVYSDISGQKASEDLILPKGK